MTQGINRRQVFRLGAGASALALLAACDTTSFNFGPQSSGGAPPKGAGQTFGTGPTRVALLLPLSGDPSLSSVGISMANAAQMAINYISSSPKIEDNITLLLLDTGSTAGGAAQQASAAISQGASLILGPLRGDQVLAAGAAAKSAGIPLIGFSNNSSAASAGVYLLNVLPETEIRRSLGYAAGRGRKTVAGIFPNTSFGQAQQAAFQQVTPGLGIAAKGTFSFSAAAQASGIIAQLAPQLTSGAIDTLFIPDRASAPSIGAMVAQAGVPPGKVLLVGSADWDMDPAITATPSLNGAIYPAVDDSGYQALKAEYVTKFAGNPHPLATIAYTAVILANAKPLVAARYSAAALTMPGGFNGRDGVFRFLPDGRSQYALVIKQVGAGVATKVDGAKL